MLFKDLLGHNRLLAVQGNRDYAAHIGDAVERQTVAGLVQRFTHHLHAIGSICAGVRLDCGDDRNTPARARGVSSLLAKQANNCSENEQKSRDLRHSFHVRSENTLVNPTTLRGTKSDGGFCSTNVGTVACQSWEHWPRQLRFLRSNLPSKRWP